jgi:hypothetical protein
MLEHEKVHAVLVPDIVQGADVRMAQLRDRFGFAVESRAEGFVPGQIRGQDLDGHRALEAGVAGLVDLAHAALAQRRDDLVRTQPRAWIQ